MNGGQNQQQRRSRPVLANQSSILLSDQENRALFEILGKKCSTLATGIVQVYLANGNGQKWQKRCTGVCCFVKDNPKRSYFIRVYSIKSQNLLWEQELYNQFGYSTPRPYFHTFDTDNCRAGLNFADEKEAEKFKSSINEKIQQKHQRKQANSTSQHHSHQQHVSSQPPATRTSPYSANFATVEKPPPPPEEGKKSKKNKKNKKGKLTKADISMPSGFKHVGHVGWDPNKGFDMNNVDPVVKDLFVSAGITEKDMQDQEKAQFIYDFIEKKGGVDAIKKDQETRRTRRPPPPPSRGAAPPPPPPRKEGGPPPPPHRQDNFRHAATAPPPPQRRAQPPPPPGRGGRDQHPPHRHQPPPPSSNIPPPPPISSAIPPPPPLTSNVPPPPPLAAGIPPPPPMTSSGPPAPPALPSASAGRGDLLAAIRQGTGLKPAAERQVAPAGGGRGALLDQIRGGAALKKVGSHAPDASGPPPAVEAEDGDGSLADALARALQKREKNIHSDSDSNSDNDDFDDDEWSD